MAEGHIHKRYDGELNHLHYLILEMGELVIGQLIDALKAFESRNISLAQAVVSRDSEVDLMEVKTDEEITKLLARRSPVSADLRMVITVSKCISDLERIGDEAVRIAGLALLQFERVAHNSESHMLYDVKRMGKKALFSLEGAVKLFEVWDEDLAQGIIDNHNAMEEEFQSDLRGLITYIMEDNRTIGYAITVALIIKSLERIGHYAKNMTEYIVFQLKGVDVRGQQPKKE